MEELVRMEKLNVAIADDNERMVDLLSTLVKGDKELELVGQAADGQEIYKIIKEKEPDVVLLDIIMPKMDGITVMEKLNEDPSVRKRPAFIIISAVGQERIIEDAFRLGACYYIMKPFDNDMVLNRIKQFRKFGKGIRRENRGSGFVSGFDLFAAVESPMMNIVVCRVPAVKSTAARTSRKRLVRCFLIMIILIVCFSSVSPYALIFSRIV